MDDNRNGATTILLICREGKSRQVYQAELESPGVTLICVQALVEFFSHGVYSPLNGILVDMPTYMRSDEDEKLLLADLVGLFPALRLRCHEPSGEIRTLPFGTAYPGKFSPAVFVHEYCKSFVPRKIRTCERSLLNMHALLNKCLPVTDLSGARSATVDVSHGGCFLISFEPWFVGDLGWLVLPELEDNAPIQVEVCFVKMWGKSRSLPGMGVRFIELTRSQSSELSRLGGRNLMQEDQ